MQLSVADSQQQLVLQDAVFDRPYNEDLIHQIVVAYRNASRAGTKAQKTRSEVAGTTKKSKKQKGGGARHGALTAPIFVGGGVTFAAKPRRYDQKVNRKQYRAAIATIFSELCRQGRLKVVESFDVDQIKTKSLVEKIQALNVGQRVTVISETASEKLLLSARNLKNIQICDVQTLDPLVLISADTVLMTTDAVKNVEEWLA